jgi:hypothetical protein
MFFHPLLLSFTFTVADPSYPKWVYLLSQEQGWSGQTTRKAFATVAWAESSDGMHALSRVNRELKSL